MRILVVTSKVPYPAIGADEKDRLEGIRLLTELGHQVSVIAKIAPYQKPEQVAAMQADLGVLVVTVPYITHPLSLRRFTDVRWIDGAAFDFADPVLAGMVRKVLLQEKFDKVVVDNSFGWPVIAVAHQAGVPTLVRSLQNEAAHILVDEGHSLGNYVRSFGKLLGERTMAREADGVIALNRNEEAWYRAHGATHTVTVPLRYLPKVLEEAPNQYHDRSDIHVLFSGATYSVRHNADGARRLITEIAPALERAAPGKYTIHVTGGKLPPDIAARAPSNVRLEGYIADYGTFVRDMDVAVTQALGTVGMHGKLFEPIARGIPTIGMPYALGGFPFAGGESILFGEKTDDVVTHLLALGERSFREKIGRRGREVAQKYFSRDVVLQQLSSIL